MAKHLNTNNPRGVQTGLTEADMEAGRSYLTDVVSDPKAPSEADERHTSADYRIRTGKGTHRKN